MREDELQNARQKARLPSCMADRVRLDAGYGQETRQEIRVGRDKSESADGDGFRFRLISFHVTRHWQILNVIGGYLMLSRIDLSSSPVE
jgi:hypothetical protein